MNIDDLDLTLMMFFLEFNGKTHTSCDVVKVIYAPESNAELIKLTTRVNYRLNKWVKQNVFLKEFKQEGKKKIAYYTINLEGIYYGDAELSIVGKKIDIGEAIILELKNGQYFVVFKNSC
nr:MAG: DNA-binding protein containing wHTH domain [uncultured archaeon]